MVLLYISKYIQKRGDGMVICPQCGHSFKMEYKCLRCGYVWTPRNPNATPKVCPNPKCKSPYWNKLRKNQ